MCKGEIKMQKDQAIKFRDYMFLFIVFFTVFNYIPHLVQLEFLGSQYGTKLSLYPMIFGVLGTIWFGYSKHIESIKAYKAFGCFMVIYVVVLIISIIHGLKIYPYYDAILSEPADHMKKVFFIKAVFLKFGVDLTRITLLKIWILIRAIKQTCAEVVWGFGLSFLIFVWYKNDAKNLIRIMSKAVMGASAFVCIYGILDFFYLAGCQWASQLLSTLNPLLHDVPSNNQWWWPPLLWPNQLRSVFPEPSYLGIWSAFAMPWLWYGSYCTTSRKTKLCYNILNLALPLCLFLSRARTANALLVGELVLFAIGTIIYGNNIWKSFIKALLCVILAFCLSLASFQFFINSNKKESTHDNNLERNNAVVEYIDDNLTSLAEKDTRSNGTRYAIMKAGLNIGKDYPMFGVGKTFRNLYLLSYLSDQEKKYSEIQVYIKTQHDKGILNPGIPVLTEYTNRFAETGIIGVILYFIPIVVLLYKIYYFFKEKARIDETIPMLFFLISLLGILASGIGDSLDVTYCYWILLGVGYTICYNVNMNIKR